MPTIQDKDFMDKLKILEAYCVDWIAAYEANYVDAKEPNLHIAKDRVQDFQLLARDFESIHDFDAVTGTRIPDDRFMIDLLEDNVCGQVNYMEFLETYSYSGPPEPLQRAINGIKSVEGDLRLFDSTIEWIRDSVDRW